MDKTLIIVRGIAGSGKSTFAELMSEDGKYSVLSADQYFEKNGEYIFKPEFLSEAHLWCRSKVFDEMKLGIKKIFVANTFTTDGEIEPYINLANKFGYKVFSIIVEKRTHDNPSVHNVPEETIEKMKRRFSIKL
jgi:predicted kinase